MSLYFWCMSLSRAGTVVPLALGTLALGIPLDATATPWAQPVVSLWAWTALLWIVVGAAPRHRLELAACVVLATAGELFLKDAWGLYEYRLGNLPLFIPAGHALVFAAAAQMSAAAPRWLPGAVVVGCVATVTVGAVRGYDTFGLVWGLAFVALVWRSANPRLCATLFLFALVIESYGTALGGWRYYTVEPWFGLTTTNPPVWIGAIYCTLETLVRVTVQAVDRIRGGRVAASAMGLVSTCDSAGRRATVWAPLVQAQAYSSTGVNRKGTTR
jgi:hypothetical protein